MALVIVILTEDFQIRWNVLSLSLSERESEKWPLGLREQSSSMTRTGAEGTWLGHKIFSTKFYGV